jgi:hypothetical protein
MDVKIFKRSNKARAVIAIVILVAASLTAVLGSTALSTTQYTLTDASSSMNNTTIQNATNASMNETSESNETNETGENATIISTEVNETNETNETNATVNETNTSEIVNVTAANLSASSITVSAEQPEGMNVSWRIPSKRAISAEVFGTPRYPLMDDNTLHIRIQQALSQLPAPLNEKVAKLLQQMPDLVALPRSDRMKSSNGTFYTTTAKDTSEGQESRDVNGSFSATYTDRQLWDIPGQTTQTDDQFNLTISFTDPAGNNYTAIIKSLYQPHIPAWQTGGGVLTNAWIHGTTGTETPLSPRVYAYGAAWMIGDLWVNGNLTQQDMFMHLMTTQQDDNKNDTLALDDQLPLETSNTPSGQIHDTEFEVLPVHITADGPEYMPVNTSYTINGTQQDFISVTFENDTITSGPTWQQPAFTPFRAFSPFLSFVQNVTKNTSKNATGTPRIVILQPASGARIRTDCLAVSVKVKNFNLGPQGQVLVALDFNPAKQNAPKGARFKVTTESTVEFEHVKTGKHIVYAMLVSPSREILSPPVIAQRTVTIAP